MISYATLQVSTLAQATFLLGMNTALSTIPIPSVVISPSPILAIRQWRTQFRLAQARCSDQALYPNPEEFNPDRYLNPKYPTYKEPLTKYPNVINHHVFGYGRRNCMGMEIVDYQLVTIMGSLAWAFNVSRKKNKAGADIPVHFSDWTDLLITRPAPFVFDLKPRDEHKAKLIDTMFEEALVEHSDLAF